MRRPADSRGHSLASVTITLYQRRYRGEVRDLVFHSYRMHSHLDWQDTDQFLDTEDALIRLAWTGHRLVGVIGFAPPLFQTTWMRLAAVSDDIQPQQVLTALWYDALPDLQAIGIHTAALLVLRNWILHYADELGFRYVEDIVTLRRQAQPLPNVPLARVGIRPIEPGDIETITAIDQAAFVPPWQLTLPEVRQAIRASAICTVATANNGVIGYQLSTLYFDGAHLARLAVHPGAQGLGVGATLLTDLIERLNRKGVTAITVNTQATNQRSQQLYQRFGFERNGYDMPVWMAEIE